jgi:hypothetical protein
MASSTYGQKGWGHGEAGMETEEGTAFESLPRREPCGELPRRAGMAGPADSGLKRLLAGCSTSRLVLSFLFLAITCEQSIRTP